MSNKNSVNYGVVWQKDFENSNMPKYNMAVKLKEVKDLPVDEHGNIKMVLSKRDTIDEKNGITHDIQTPGSPKKDDVVISINKEKLLTVPPTTDGTVYLEAVAKREIGRNRSNYLVRQMQPAEGEKPIYVGEGWTESQRFKPEYVGFATRKDFDNGGKLYNASITKETFDEMKADKYGNINISAAPRKDVPGEYSLYRSVGPDPYSDFTISVKKADIQAMGDDNGYYKVNITDKQKIGKNHADLTVFENTYHKEKAIAEKEGKDIKDVKMDRNYVGNGWSSTIDHIRLQKEDLTKKGLSAALAENHHIKAMAIMQINPNLVDKKHVKLLTEKIDKGEKVNKQMELMAASTLKKNEEANSKGVKV